MLWDIHWSYSIIMLLKATYCQASPNCCKIASCQCLPTVLLYWLLLITLFWHYSDLTVKAFLFTGSNIFPIHLARVHVVITCFSYSVICFFNVFCLDLSILQNGDIPQYIGEQNRSEIFLAENSSLICLQQIRKGLKELGFYQVRGPNWVLLWKSSLNCKVVFIKTWEGMDFLKIGQRGGFNFFFDKRRDRKKGWDGVIRGRIKKIYKTFSISQKETQSFKAY